VEHTAQDRRPGRPRDPSIDEAVLDAALKLLAVEGTAGMSMDQVATAAGVSKATLYARWPGKTELIGAALWRLQVENAPVLTGNIRDDLVALFVSMLEQYAEVGAMSIMGTCLLDEASGSGELLAIVRASTVLPRRERFAEVLRRGVESGELRTGLNVEQAVSIIVGALYADHLAGRPTGPDWAASVVDSVLDGIRS
jgi:AcrR family transcriptional regulator